LHEEVYTQPSAVGRRWNKVLSLYVKSAI